MAAVAKVFRIELQGGTEVTKDFSDLKKTIAQMGAAVKAAKKELSELLATKADAPAIDAVKKKLADLEKQLKKTQQAYKENQSDIEREAKAQKALNDEIERSTKSRIAEARAMTAEENARKAKVQADNAESAAIKKKKAELDGLAGSYNQVKNQLAQLRPFVNSGGIGGTIAFNGQNLNFDQAINEFKRLSFAEQDFRRQFQKDGTIVGEYAQGIVNAFNRLGIDDIIKNQVNGAKQELSALEQRTKDLVTAYRAAQQAGSADLNKIEKEIHDNVLETQKLNKAIQATEVQLKGMGGVGTQITNSIKQNFKDLKNSAAQFAVGFFAFQGIFSGIQKTFSETIALDSLDASLKVVSGSEAELAKNQEFLAETTERLGLVYTDTAVAFKNFYAASTLAGISADETRAIFASAAAASANLKLSQEQTNGILLAFGQIASKGKVQAEELRGQIGERIPGAFSIAAKAIGVTQAELNKMLEQGLVSAADFLPKFAAELQKTFGGDSTKEIEGLQASVNRLKNTFTELIQDNQGGLSGFFTLLINGATFLIKNLPIIITLLAAYAAIWATANAAMIKARLVTIAQAIAMTAQNAVIVISNTITAAYTAAVNIMSKAQTRAAVTSGVLAAALRFLSGPLGIILTIITLITVSFTAFGRAAATAVSELTAFARQQRINLEINSLATKAIAEQKTEIDGWISVIKDASTSADTKKKAVEELIKIDKAFSSVIKDNVIDLNALDAAYQKVIQSITLKARAEAAATLTEKKRAALVELQVTRQTLETEFARGPKNQAFQQIDLDEGQKELLRNSKLFESGAIASFNEKGAQIQRARFKEIQNFLKQQEKIAQDVLKDYMIAQADAEGEVDKDLQKGVEKQESVFAAFKRLVDNNGTEKDFQELLKRVQEQMKGTALLSKEYQQLRKLEEDIKNLIDPKKGRTGGRESKPERDPFRDIDARRDQELADEALYFENRFETEKEYLLQVRDINVGAINAKLALLDGSNARERKMMAEFQLEKIKITQDTNKKIFDIENTALENKLKNQQIANDLILEAQSKDPELTETGKLSLKESFLQQQLVDQIIFNQNQLALEKKYGQQSVELEQKRKEAIEKIQQQLRENLNALPAAQIRDIQQKGKDQQTLSDLRTADGAGAIFSNNESAIKQARQIRELESKAAVERLAIEKETAAEVLKVKEDQYAKGLIAEREYLEALTDYKTKESALYQVTANQQISSTQRLIKALKGVKDAFLEQVFGIKQYTNDAAGEAQKVEDLINFTLDNVKNAIDTAYNAYFTREADKIDRAKETQLAFLEREQERVSAQAQSEDERATIERQFAQKRQAEERKAFEEHKKLAKKQATIDFALAAIKTFAQFGWPLGLIGVAALGVAYAAQISAINAQQFAEGGQVQPESPGNGMIRTRSNIPAQKNGDNVLATVRTGEVILNKRQQTALGGAKTFKAIGVPGFADGGRVSQLGSSLKAPSFTARNPNAVGNAAADGQQQIARLAQMTEQVLAAVYASDQKPVVLNPRAVEKSNDRNRKDVNLATI